MKPEKPKTGFIFYHFIFALFPVLFLYSYNIEEVSFSVIIRPAVLIFILNVLLWLFFRIIIKNKIKAALLTFLSCFMFFSYGHFENIVQTAILKKIHLPVIVLVVLWVVLFIFLGVMTCLTRKELRTLTSFLQIFVLVLLLYSVFNIFLFHIQSANMKINSSLSREDIQLRPAISGEQLPDIYYLIFDRYANQYSLKYYYDFDNSDMIDFLTQKGFYVASKSRCNYPETYLSLASTLNMEYLDYLLKDGPIHKRVIYQKLQDFLVRRLLKNYGYKYIHFGCWWEPTKTNKYADMVYKGKGIVNLSQDFIYKLLDTTLVSHITEKNIKSLAHRKNVIQVFKKLNEIPAIKGPKLVFLHMLLPHHPFVFGPNGEPLDRVKPQEQQQNYVNQVRFANIKIKALINQIFAKSENPPIIILQSDEGPGKEEMPILNLAKIDRGSVNRNRIKIKYGILNAYYLPKVDKSSLYETITPVNTFRLIFNLYFGGQFKILQDSTYFPKSNKVYLKRLLYISSQLSLYN